jgi:hypothetical protein
MASILRFALYAALLTSLFGCGLARQAEMQKASEEAKQVMQAAIALGFRLVKSRENSLEEVPQIIVPERGVDR